MPDLDTEKTKWITNRCGISVSETHFISREGAKHYGYPAYWYNDGKGGHVGVVKFEGEYYLTQPTIKPHPDPIPYGKSSRQ